MLLIFYCLYMKVYFILIKKDQTTVLWLYSSCVWARCRFWAGACLSVETLLIVAARSCVQWQWQKKNANASLWYKDFSSLICCIHQFLWAQHTKDEFITWWVNKKCFCAGAEMETSYLLQPEQVLPLRLKADTSVSSGGCLVHCTQENRSLSLI